MNGQMRIAIGSDHAGYVLKASIVCWLTERQIAYLDLGADSLDPDDDYPDFAAAVARAVASRKTDLGITICGTGVGSCIAANKVAGVRAALCTDSYCAKCSRLHNDANVLCLGARVLGAGLAVEIVCAWLGTSFSGEERHRRRIGKVTRLEASGAGARRASRARAPEGRRGSSLRSE
jgi:ribose 5-phosphate isomerase B